MLINRDGNPMYSEEKVLEMTKTVGKLCEHFLPQNYSLRSGGTVKHCAHFTHRKQDYVVPIISAAARSGQDSAAKHREMHSSIEVGGR